MRPRREPGRVWALIALGLALAAAAVLAFAPTGSASTAGSGVTTGPSGTGAPPPTVTHPTLIEVNGLGVLLVLAVPVVLTLLAVVVSPLRARAGLRATLAGLLLVGCLLGAMSVGLFFLPAASALVVSAARSGRPRVPGEWPPGHT